MYRSLIFSILFICSFTACIPESVDIDIPQAEPRLVVNSQVVSEDLFLLHLGKSFGALEFSDNSGDQLTEEFLSQLLVENAQVELSHSGGKTELINFGSGFYAGVGLNLQEQEFYQLQVKDSTSGLEVFSSSQVLPMANWESLEFDYEYISYEFNNSTTIDSVLVLKVAFQDFADENYYMINAYNISDFEDNTSGDDILLNRSADPVYIYSDQLYTDNIIRDTLRLGNFRQGDTVAFALAHITKDYYNYLSTRERSDNSFFANLLQEPVNYPSNIEGGYGFFNLSRPRVELRVLE